MREQHENNTDAWKRARTACGAGTLHVSHRAEEPHWVEAAQRYWNGTLATLELVESSRHAIVHRGIPFENGPFCYFKRFLLRDWRDRIKHLFRPSRASRALAGGRIVRACGFRAPKAYCVVERVRFGRTVESALVMEAAENAPDLRAWINDPALGVADDRALKRRLLAAFGREVGAWHGAGLYHGDMRIGNILCRREGDDFGFTWLDNERTRRFAVLPRRLRLQNLVQINMETYGVSLADRMRVWKAYAAAARIPESEQRPIMRDVIRLTQSRWHRRGWL